MKKTNPPALTSLSRTVRELGRPPAVVDTTMAVGSGSTPRSLAANASDNQDEKSTSGSAGIAVSNR